MGEQSPNQTGAKGTAPRVDFVRERIPMDEEKTGPARGCFDAWAKLALVVVGVLVALVFYSTNEASKHDRPSTQDTAEQRLARERLDRNLKKVQEQIEDRLARNVITRIERAQHRARMNPLVWDAQTLEQKREIIMQLSLYLSDRPETGPVDIQILSNSDDTVLGERSDGDFKVYR
jgi:hypothetical protein